MPQPILQFNLKKLDWYPKNLDDIVDHCAYTFEKAVGLDELDIKATNHLHRFHRIVTNEDLVTFLQIQQNAEGEPIDQDDKFLKVGMPPRVLPIGFKPGEAPILATGKKIAAFDGDGRADCRVVDFQLRIFECGHFYMKQSLGSQSQVTPYWVIFEGRWRRSIKGYRLEFFLQYPRAGVRAAEFIINGQNRQTSASLNFSGNQEIDLKGFLPVIMPGSEASCWAALKRKAEKAKSLSRKQKGFGEDEEDEDEEEEGEDEDDEEEEEEKEEEDDQLNANQKQELVQSLMQELKPEQQQELRHALGKHGMSPELYQDLSPPLRQALGRLQKRAQMAARRRQFSAEGEPTWPMYLGLVLFVLVFLIFSYLYYEEHYGSGKPLDIDEDDYWRTDEFF